MARKRYVVRLQIDLYEYLKKRAEKKGKLAGTLITSLVNQFAIVVASDLSLFPANIELFVPTKIPTRKTASNQISVYVDEETENAINSIMERTGYYKVADVVTGILLATPEGKLFLESR